MWTDSGKGLYSIYNPQTVSILNGINFSVSLYLNCLCDPVNVESALLRLCKVFCEKVCVLSKEMFSSWVRGKRDWVYNSKYLLDHLLKSHMNLFPVSKGLYMDLEVALISLSHLN